MMSFKAIMGHALRGTLISAPPSSVPEQEEPLPDSPAVCASGEGETRRGRSRRPRDE